MPRPRRRRASWESPEPKRLRRRYHAACAESLTYPEAGATQHGPLPGGYAHTRRRVRLGTGRELFERAGELVLAWGAQEGAGFSVVHPGTPAEPGDTVLVCARFPWLPRPRLVIPCRVVWQERGPDRIGFGYGTLAGHPERGEESFAVTRDERGEVWFEVAAFSRQASWYARLGGPVSARVQQLAIGRYLRAVEAAARQRG